jgi:glutamyl-tRNA synthetase
MSCVTRFAPSPTGFLHLGNARTALINFLYTKQRNGKFFLRIDDTDVARCQIKFLRSIFEDLSWLEIHWNETFSQLEKKDRYKSVLEDLKKSGAVYPCYETKEELENKRINQIKNSKPPIYNREALVLTPSQIAQFEQSGRVPHYRFLLDTKCTTSWRDLVKGNVKFEGKDLSDPVIFREDGAITYLLSSVVDDIDANVTDIIRGEDHVSNTAIQIQLFKALKATVPNFGHLSLLQTSEGKISKRAGGMDLQAMRKDFHPMAINSLMMLLGTSKSVEVYNNMQDLIQNFDITTYSKAQTRYHEDELRILNAKLIRSLDYESVQKCTISDQNDESDVPYCSENVAKELQFSKTNTGHFKTFPHLTKELWNKIRNNVQSIAEIEMWCRIFQEDPVLDKDTVEDQYLQTAAKTLPQIIDSNSASVWMNQLEEITGKKGRALFLPIRLALTGLTQGPTISDVLLVLTRDTVIKRLTQVKFK